MGEILGGFSGLKFRLIVLASVMVVAALIWSAARENTRNTNARAVASGITGPSHPTNRAKRYAAIAKDIDLWAVAGLGMGTSFILAIISGSLMRVSFQSMVVLLVIGVGVSIVLDHKGVVEPFWSDYLSSVSDVKMKLAAQTESMVAFLAGHLPPFVSAMLGFLFGLKR